MKYEIQAVFINDEDQYTLHWPMKGGSLNLHSGMGGSLSCICANLETIWAFAIETVLNIPLSSLKVDVVMWLKCIL